MSFLNNAVLNNMVRQQSALNRLVADGVDARIHAIQRAYKYDEEILDGCDLLLEVSLWAGMRKATETCLPIVL